MYIKLINNTPERYSLTQLRRDNPQVSFPQVIPDACAVEYGVYPLQATDQPTYDLMTSRVVEGIPVQQGEAWVQAWDVVALTPEELQAVALELKGDIVAQTQQRLDDFAHTRNYDGILSACTYATSTVPKFQQEGQYCVTARDQTWAVLYQIMAEVEAGTREMPSDFAEIEPQLPVLAWLA